MIDSVQNRRQLEQCIDIMLCLQDWNCKLSGYALVRFSSSISSIQIPDGPGREIGRDNNGAQAPVNLRGGFASSLGRNLSFDQPREH